MQRIDSIKAAARNLRDLVVDTTPASLCGSYIDADALIHPISGQLRGCGFYFYSGAGAGQQRTVGSFDPTYNRLGFPQAFTTLPSTNSKFLLFEHFSKDEYDNALDRMVGVAELKFLEEKVATLTLVATQYEYAVPSGYEYIRTIKLVPSGSTDESDYGGDDEVSRIFEFPPRYWRIEPNAAGSFNIIFDPRKIDLGDFDDECAKIIGQAKPNISPTDNATIPKALEEYLINGASMLLSSQRISEGQEWRTKFQIFRDMTQGLEAYIYRTRYGKRVGA